MSRGRRCDLRQPRRPGRQPRAALLQQRADAAGFYVDDPELPIPRTIRHERHMTTVGCPGWVFVSPDRGELSHRARPYVEDEHLQRATSVARLNASVLPSGENAGVKSSAWPVVATGARLPLATSCRKSRP